jgi:hypothetical protein
LIDFDYLLVEAFDPRGLTYHVLLSIKRITAILMSNPYEVQRNWLMIQNKDRERLIQYLKSFTRIDDVMKVMTIDVIQFSKELLIKSASNEIGGSYLRRDEDRLEAEDEVLEKKLLMN